MNGWVKFKPFRQKLQTRIGSNLEPYGSFSRRIETTINSFIILQAMSTKLCQRYRKTPSVSTFLGPRYDELLTRSLPGMWAEVDEEISKRLGKALSENQSKVDHQKAPPSQTALAKHKK
jgi:guanylate kinase